MIDFVLRLFAFRRSPRATARLMLFGAVLAGSALAGSIAIADATQPQVLRVETGDTGDGNIDSIVVTFDRAMDASISQPGGWTVDGYTVASTTWVQAQVGSPTTQLKLAVFRTAGPQPGGDTGAVPEVHYAAQPVQSQTRSFGLGKEADPVQVEAITTSDKASPVLMRVTAVDFVNPNVFNNALDRMDLIFSENVKLAGQTPQERHVALEQVILLTSCQTVDGNGVDKHNFARPPSASGGPGAASSDPIVLPPPSVPAPTTTSDRIRVVQKTDSQPSTAGNVVIAIPEFCKLSIDPSFTSNITDLASPVANASSRGDLPAGAPARRDVNIGDSELFYDANGQVGLRTRDLVPDPPGDAPAGDGKIDAIEVVFDHEIIDSTVTSSLIPQFSVFSGTEPATISSITTRPGTGEIADASVFLHITDADWSGQVKPRVSFNPGSSCALRTKVPAGETFYACAAGFGLDPAQPGIESVDKVAPVLQNVSTIDSSPADGIIDRVQLNFNEPVAEASTTAGWTIGGAAATAIEVVDEDRRIVRLDFPPGSSPNTGATPAVSYALQGTGGTVDGDANEIGAGTLAATDGAAPVVYRATSFDLNGDGKIDAATFQFSEAVDQSLAAPADFTIGTVPADAFGTSPIDPEGAGADLVTVTSTGQPVGTGHVAAAYTGSTLADLASNEALPKNVDAASVVDAAAPVATITTTPESPFAKGTITVKVSFTEIMDTSAEAIPVVTIDDTNVQPYADPIDHTNGFRNNDKSKWDGSVALDENNCPDQNGCDLEITLDGGKDLTGNVTVDGAVLPVNLDAVAPDAATDESVTGVQKAGFAPIAANTIGGSTTQLTLTASIVAGQVNQIGQAAGGSAEILKGDQSLTPVAKVENISATADQITVTTAFASIDELKAALPEGPHTLKVMLCDGALNCSTSDGIQVVADYTPVTVALDSPNSGTLQGASKACIAWNADEANASLQNVKLRYSMDGGSTFPNMIADNVGPDGAGACDGSGTAHGWTVPLINTTSLKVQAVTLDSFNNEGIAASAENITIQTTYVLTHRASASVIANGAPVTFSGAFQGNNVPIAGRSITIQRRMRGQTVWQNIGSAVTSSNGGYAWTGRPGMNADWRSVSVGGNGYPSLTSSTSYVAVRVVLNFVTSASSLARNQFVTLSGSIVPAKRGVKVALLMYSGGKWIRVAETISSSSGGYRFTYRLPSTGTRTFRTYYAQQDALHAGNYSVTRNVTWR